MVLQRKMFGSDALLWPETKASLQAQGEGDSQTMRNS